MTTSELHNLNAWLLIAANVVAGLWCAVAYWWPAAKSKLMWAVVIVAELLVFSQALLGALLTNREGGELNGMHALYGFSAIAAVGILYSYHNSGFLKGKETILYAGGSFFIMGLGLRNIYL